jgi:3-mercaptopyruvate sulfurtransferase SseA
VALKLQRLGIQRVRPLAGGIEAWKDLGFPVTALEAAAVPSG